MMKHINTRGQQGRTMRAVSVNRSDPEVAAALAVPLLLATMRLQSLERTARRELLEGERPGAQMKPT